MSERENGPFAAEADSLFSSPAKSDEDKFPIPAHPAGEGWDFAQRSRNLCDVIVAMSRRQAFSDKDLKDLAKFFSEVYDQMIFDINTRILLRPYLASTGHMRMARRAVSHLTSYFW